MTRGEPLPTVQTWTAPPTKQIAMRNKFIPLAVALVFGSVAAVGFTKMMKASPQAETVEIFVAVRDISAAEEITQESIRLAQWPASTVPRDAIRDWEAMAGQFAAQPLYADEPIVLRKLMDSKDSKTLDIPKGFSVVTLKTDEASSVANLVSPGDRVNVIGFFTKSDVIPATTTRTVLSGVKVFAVDGRTTRLEANEDGNAQAARTVSLLIHSGDAEAWTCAKEIGKISLSLGRPDDGEGERQDGPNPAGQAFLDWLAAHQASKNVKPAAAAPVAALVKEQPAAAPAVAKPAVEHQMVKINAAGEMSVYTWVEGSPVPQIQQPDTSTSSSDAPTRPEDDLSYLNGNGSPLYGGATEEDIFGARPPQPAPNPAEANEGVAEPTE